jgi:hydroxymethylpyrimidine kinase / phosphomethylpyrimidine kinase / thiamine-phosphate diphosphorylase
VSAPLPVVWSVAGNDSGGGAGLSADQRAASAFGVHLCPVVAAVTAQNSLAVTQILPVLPEMLDAQLAALASDLRPRVIKTGLLGGVAQLQVLVRWVDQLRRDGPVALVVDPVLRASTGAAFADAQLLAAYRDLLLPRATVITPNRREAAALLGQEEAHTADIPAQAQALRALGVPAVLITGGDAHDSLALDWLDSPQAQGWLSLPRQAQPHAHGTGCTLATALAAGLAHGFVAADAALLAKMLCAQALRHAGPQGRGAGPVRPAPGWANDPSLLPQMSWTTEPPTGWVTRERAPDPGPYAIVDQPQRLMEVLAAGARQVQLRIKAPPGGADADWLRSLQATVQACVQAAAACGATLWVNDHWQVALAAGAQALHLGQEDLLALDDSQRQVLAAARSAGVKLGVSSHSLWELCRAASLAPDYIACGPVWPTSTKAMPWRPQGLRNLAWWSHMAPAPVVAIGGILTYAQMQQVAAAGAAGACVVRGLGDAAGARWPAWRQAWSTGQTMCLNGPALPVGAGWPTPMLPGPDWVD